MGTQAPHSPADAEYNAYVSAEWEKFVKEPDRIEASLEACRGIQVSRGRIRPGTQGARVLTSGLVYHVTGKHLRNRLFTHETCQSRWLLKKELARNDLVIVREMPDSNRLTPSFLIRKTAAL